MTVVSADLDINREERVAIMMLCGDCCETEAQNYCDLKPEVYGVRKTTEIQLDLL